MAAIIFLDIDGVLNHTGSESLLARAPTEHLRRVADAHDPCHVVLSSTWRYSAITRKRVAEHLREHRVCSGEILSQTPDLRCVGRFSRSEEILLWMAVNAYLPGDEAEAKSATGLEARRWVVEHQLRTIVDADGGSKWVLEAPIAVHRFVALDDMNLLASPSFSHIMRPVFVKTSVMEGLTAALADQAARILTGEANVDMPFALSSAATCLRQRLILHREHIQKQAGLLGKTEDSSRESKAEPEPLPPAPETHISDCMLQ